MFKSIDPVAWGDYQITVRSLMDAMIGNYAIYDYHRRDLIYKIMFTIYMLSSNVILLNFLVAILSTTFNKMRARGKFEFTRIKYQYIEKFMVPLTDKNGYQELIIQPVPINVLSFPILFLIPNKRLFKKAAYYFAYSVYWLENIIFIFFFLIKEMLSVPRLYFKTLSRINKSPKILVKIKLMFIWSFIGLFVLAYTACTDVANLVGVLLFLKDAKSKEVKEDGTDINSDGQAEKRRQAIIVNELIHSMRSIKDVINKKQSKNKEYKFPQKKKKRINDLEDYDHIKHMDEDGGRQLKFFSKFSSICLLSLPESSNFHKIFTIFLI